MMFHYHLYGLARYWNLQFLAKISPKFTFYVSRVYFIIAICNFTMKKGLKKFVIKIGSKQFLVQRIVCRALLVKYDMILFCQISSFHRQIHAKILQNYQKASKNPKFQMIFCNKFCFIPIQYKIKSIYYSDIGKLAKSSLISMIFIIFMVVTVFIRINDIDL